MTLDERLISDVMLIDIHGRVTVNEGTDHLAERLKQLVETGHTKLVIGMADVPYVDSTALSILLRTRATVSKRGGALKLMHVRGHVRELLEVTQLLRVFEAFESEADAVASFNPRMPQSSGPGDSDSGGSSDSAA
jgi:anti-sigma B factor antagonist